MHLWSFFLNFVRHCLNSGLWYSVSISAHTITQLLLQLFQVRIEHILCTGLKIISFSSTGEKRKPFIKCKETEWGILVGNIQQKVHFIFYIWPTIKLFQKGLNGYVCEKHHIYVRIKYIYFTFSNSHHHRIRHHTGYRLLHLVRLSSISRRLGGG